MVHKPLPVARAATCRLQNGKYAAAIAFAWFIGCCLRCQGAAPQQSANECHRLTTTNAPLPRVLIHDDEIRFYFPAEPHAIVFVAQLGRPRLPTAGYQVSSALLKLKKKLPEV